MKKNFWWLTILFVSLITSQSFAQNQPDGYKLKSMMAQLKSLNTYSYDYLIKMDFPDNHSEKLTGKAYMDIKNEVMYNESEAHAMLLTNRWYYRANHVDKTITLIDLDNFKSGARERENDLFNGFVISYYIDSVIMKYGILKSYRENGDTISLSLSFKINSPTRQIDVVYDYKHHFPLAIKVMAALNSSSAGLYDGPSEILQTIICTNYSQQKRPPQSTSFFVVENKKVLLKKYANYKIYDYL